MEYGKILGKAEEMKLDSEKIRVNDYKEKSSLDTIEIKNQKVLDRIKQ